MLATTGKHDTFVSNAPAPAKYFKAGRPPKILSS